MPHWNLATSYERLGRKKEAVAEYKLYLGLAPDGKYAAEARKRIQRLGG
jgi:hypothetical protein